MSRGQVKAGNTLPKLEIIWGSVAASNAIADILVEYASQHDELKILEAGCGRRWPFDLKDVNYVLTGIDIDKTSLDIRINEVKDLHEAILGDLRSVEVENDKFDIIYSSNVLEHIQGAELVLERFIKWLKPGGIMILRFPDRDSVYGYFTRVTPLWFHFFFKRYILWHRNMGKPGFGPFPTYHDPIIARKHFKEFSDKNGLIIKRECGVQTLPKHIYVFTILVGMLTFGRLAHKHKDLFYVIKKPR